MNASKENAAKAADTLKNLRDSLPPEGREFNRDALNFLEQFITAATKRLPTEAAITKDKQRKTTYNEARKKLGTKAGATRAQRERATAEA